MTGGQPQPLVTIVTPSYNQGRFIAATIESVLSQDYPHIEYIIMDGGSTDETAEVVRRYEGRLEFVSEKDRGQSHAINKGFRRARGEIVAWINSDDTLLPGAVRRAVEALAAHPEAAALYGEGYLMDEAGNVTCRFPHTQPYDFWRLANVSDYILQQSVFFRRTALEEIGWVREDLHYVMDWDLLIRLGRRWPLHYERAYFGCLREYGAAKTSIGGHRRIREIAEVLREHTGKRWPIGLFLYGLGTYADAARAAVVNWPFQERLQILINDAVHMAAGFILARQPGWHQRGGWYVDGLCAREMFFTLPYAHSGELTVEGSVPRTGWLNGQSLTFVINGKKIASEPVRNDFRVTLPVRPESGERLVFEIVAALDVMPIYDAPHLAGGARRIAFRLDRIEWNGSEYFPDGGFRPVERRPDDQARTASTHLEAQDELLDDVLDSHRP
jgi:glycosyltransferase involved in cell wall biosynthesis